MWKVSEFLDQNWQRNNLSKLTTSDPNFQLPHSALAGGGAEECYRAGERWAPRFARPTQCLARREQGEGEGGGGERIFQPDPKQVVATLLRLQVQLEATLSTLHTFCLLVAQVVPIFSISMTIGFNFKLRHEIMIINWHQHIIIISTIRCSILLPTRRPSNPSFYSSTVLHPS